MKKRKQLKQYKKQVNYLLAFYKARINKISETLACKELLLDIECITKLIQQKRIKEINIILDNFPFNCYIEDLLSWYLYDFDDNFKMIYDFDLRKIKTKLILNLYY